MDSSREPILAEEKKSSGSTLPSTAQTGGGSGGKGKKRAPLNLPESESNWLTSHIKPEDNGTIEKEFLYAQYEQGCKNLKIKIRPPNTFGRILKQLFPAIVTKRLGPQTDQRQFYCGVTWVENATEIVAPQTSKSQPPPLVTMAPLPIQPAPTPSLQPLQPLQSQQPQRKSQNFATPKKTSPHDALQPCNLFKENFANSSSVPGFMNMKKGFLAKGALTQQDQFILPAYMTAPSASTTTMRVPFQELKNPNLLPPSTPSSSVPVYTQWHNIVNPTLPHQKQKNAQNKRAKKVEGVTKVADRHGNQFYVVTKEQVLEKEEVSEEEEEEEMAIDLDFLSSEDWQHAQKVQELVQHQQLQETLRQNERKRRQDSSTVIQVSSNKKRKDGGYEPFALVSEDATSTALEETLRDASETVVVRLVQGFLSGYHVLTAEYDARHFALLNQYITAFAEILWPFQPLHWSLVDQDMIANYLRNGENERNAMALTICVAIYGGAMILNHYEEGRAIHKLCIDLYRNELKDLLDINVANAYITMASTELFFFDSGYGNVLAFELLDRAAAICEQVEGGTDTEIYQRCINLMHFLVRGKEGKARDYDQFPVTEALAHPKMVLSHVKLAEIIRVRRLVLSVLSYHAQLLEATQNPHFVPNCLALPQQQVNDLEYPAIEDVTATFNFNNNHHNNNYPAIEDVGTYNNNNIDNNLDNAMQLTYFTMEEELEQIEEEEEEEEEEGIESCLKYFERKVDPQDFKDWILVQKEDKVSPMTLHHNLNILRHNGLVKTEQAKACLPDLGQRVLEVLLHFYHGLSYLKEGNMEEALKHGRQMLYQTSDEGFCIASMHLPLLVTIFKINRCVPELVELIHRSEKHRTLSNVAALIHSAQVAIEEIQKEEEEMRQLEAERDRRAQVLGY